MMSDLPDHVSSEQDIAKATTQLQNWLEELPHPPVMVTIARYPCTNTNFKGFNFKGFNFKGMNIYVYKQFLKHIHLLCKNDHLVFSIVT